MRKINVFNFITLNGFYKGPNGDVHWHQHGAEESEYGVKNLEAGNIILFGRVTYEMMKSYWPTPMAAQQSPEMAAGMNKAEKIVFSNTLQQSDWQNTQIMKGDIVEEIKMLKSTPGKNMTILGSGSIVTLFSENGLIDEYNLMLDPVVLGEGTPIFNKIEHPPELELISTRVFKTGVILLNYARK